MASAETIVRICNDAIDTLEAIKKRSTLAHHQAKGANRQANRLGTTVTGGRGEDSANYSDPSGDEAVSIISTLERVQSSCSDLKQCAYDVANELAEWAPNRPADGGVRRCGADDCAREHHALGWCQAHYRAYQRLEERRRVIAERRSS